MSLEQLRSYRIAIPGVEGDVAAFDLVATAVGGAIIGKYMGVDPIVSIPLTFAAGVVVHKAMGISTPVTDSITCPCSKPADNGSPDKRSHHPPKFGDSDGRKLM